jgi:hypothetical protein
LLPAEPGEPSGFFIGADYAQNIRLDHVPAICRCGVEKINKPPLLKTALIWLLAN